jgi:hypothetical protein
MGALLRGLLRLGRLALRLLCRRRRLPGAGVLVCGCFALASHGVGMVSRSWGVAADMAMQDSEHTGFVQCDRQDRCKRLL